jgi:hypothetical protein
LDGYQHGKDIWAVYGAKLGLIPEFPDQKKVWFRSTESPLTQQSAGGVLRGIWPTLYLCISRILLSIPSTKAILATIEAMCSQPLSPPLFGTNISL